MFKKLLFISCLLISGCFDDGIFTDSQGNSPIIEPVPPIQAIVEETTRVNIIATDEDGDVLTYSMFDNPPWISIQNNVISITPLSAHVGEYILRLRVSDGKFNTETEATLIVSSQSTPPDQANRAPKINAIPRIQSIANNPTQVIVVASDEDGDTLSYSLVNPPSWVGIQGNTISLTPSPEHAGEHNFKVRVSDGVLSTELDVALVVNIPLTPIDPNLVNHAPEINEIAPFTLDIQQASQIQVNANDRDNDTLTYQLLNAPDFVSIDQKGLLAISALSKEGDFIFQVSVSDGSLDTTRSITMTINNPHYGSDNDGDGIDDGVELKYGLDPNNPADAFQDPDGDGLLSLAELAAKRTLLLYSAQYNGPLLNNTQWVKETVGSRESLHNQDYVQRGNLYVQQLHDDDRTRTSHTVISNNLNFDRFAKELYQHGGLFSLSFGLYREGGAVHLFISPANTTDNVRKPLILELTRIGADGVRAAVSSGPSVSFASGHPDGKIHKLEIELFGNNSYGGEIRFDNNVVYRETTNMFVTRATLKEGLSLLTSGVNYRGFDLYEMKFQINSPHIVTNPNQKDTDADGIDDDIEIEIGLNALDPSDGYTADTDGDGVINGIEIDQSFNPLDPRDQIGIDSDGDGVNNNLEIANGMDPFESDDLSLDPDKDGLSTQIELEYFLNPNDPDDGFNADNDGDGITNGAEIANNTNPNDHKLQIKDRFTTTLIIDDSNNDGKIDTNDSKKSVTLERYSLRKKNAELIFFRDQAENRYTFSSLLPEVRTFRGRVDGVPDSAIFATVWEDCLISYFVYFGANAKPDFRLGPDAAHITFENVAFDHASICDSTKVSDSRYQRGLQANFEPVAYRADLDPPPNENYFPKSNSFHLFEHSQSFQASYRTWSTFGHKDINRTLALMEHHANLGDQTLAKAYYERVAITDFLVELTGKGDPGDGSVHADWDDNWVPIRNEFWGNRRSEPNRYWHEHLYWNQPAGANGFAYGQLIQSSLITGTYIHEMGHNLGSKHEGFAERFRGGNLMGRATTAPATATIVHQNIAAPRRKVEKTGVTQYQDLRIAVADWNFHPLAQPDHLSIYRDESAVLSVLDNDSDANNHRLTITSVTVDDGASDIGAIAAQLTITSDQKIQIVPPKGFVGIIDAYYIIEDQTGLSSRGLIHVNVEPKGISDIITYDHGCIDDASAVATYDNRTGYGALFSSTPRESKIAVANWGYARRTKDSDGNDETVSCASHISSAGNSNSPDDKAATWASIQYPITNNQLRKNEATYNFEYHPHLYEINNKDFSVMFWFKPSADYTGYTEIARRGRLAGHGFDGDGWIIGTNGTSLLITIHDKSQLTENRLLRLEVENIAELIDIASWAHVAMTINWTTKELTAFVNGKQVGQIAIPANFTMVSSSGTTQSYSWGSYAAFGQQSGTLGVQPGFYSLAANNGFDDLVVAHIALTPSTIQDIYQGKLPAYNPTPINGRHTDMNDVLTLTWQPHTDIQTDIQGYNVYLANDEISATARTSSVLLGSPNSTSFDVSAMTFDKTKAYYWIVDTILTDGSIISGEVWSFWQYQPATVQQSPRPKALYQFAKETEPPHECRGVHIDFWINEQLNQNKG